MFPFLNLVSLPSFRILGSLLMGLNGTEFKFRSRMLRLRTAPPFQAKRRFALRTCDAIRSNWVAWGALSRFIAPRYLMRHKCRGLKRSHLSEFFHKDLQGKPRLLPRWPSANS